LGFLQLRGFSKGEWYKQAEADRIRRSTNAQKAMPSLVNEQTRISTKTDREGENHVFLLCLFYLAIVVVFPPGVLALDVHRLSLQ
jgi:hypothetical protein